MKKKSLLYYIAFAILMIGLGCSDSLRGVFAPVFQDHFSLSTSGVSMIVTVSYIGNLVFMLLGSRLADAFGMRRIFAASMASWVAAMVLYLLTDSYVILLVGVFFAMGASTLLNMLMNIMSPTLFLAPGTIINTLFFIQTFGTTFTQSVIGANVSSFAHWKLVNAVLAALGGLVLAAFLLLSKGEAGLQKKVETKEAKADGKPAAGGYAQIVTKPVFWLFILTFGFYFVAEHGVMNWMNIYCQNWFGMTPAKAAMFPALFSGGVMVGRLVFAPLVTKLGIRKALFYCMAFGSVIYVAVFLLGGSAMYLLALSGLGFSIVYPTMTMCIQLFFPEEITTTASGTILAAATAFDILFNAVFGSIIDAIGYGSAMMIMPVSAVVCLVLYVVLVKRCEPVREI